MRTLYLDIFSGISGDMFIGAMLDLGVNFEWLRAEVARLGLNGFHLHADRRMRGSIQGVKFDVRLNAPSQGAVHGATAARVQGQPAEHSKSSSLHSHVYAHGHSHSEEHHHEHEHEHGDEHEHGRSFGDIRQLIDSSGLTDAVKRKVISIFHRVAVAEGKIHGLPSDQVHFHEVGALDSIIDIVGACLCLEHLGWPQVKAANVVEGHGWVDCAHGRFPVPTAATLEILGARGIPVTQCEEPHELVTPTGAALLAELVDEFGPMRGLVAVKIGYGLGTRENRTRPNVLRAVLGETEADGGHDWETDEVTILETNLDDVSGEVLGAFVEKALAAGALDVFHTPVQMKKNRPGVMLTVLCGLDQADRFTELILRETTSFGVRRHIAQRRKLRRELKEVPTAFGVVQVKLGMLDGRVIQVAPEFEACRLLAQKADVPLWRIYEAAKRAAQVEAT